MCLQLLCRHNKARWSCTFSLRSPPALPLQLAFHLSALSPRRAAAAVPKYGCHRAALWSAARSNNLVSAARLPFVLASAASLWVWRRTLALYVPSLLVFFFFAFFFLLSLSLFLDHLGRLQLASRSAERPLAAQRGAAALSSTDTGAPLHTFGHQPLWIQSCRALIYLLPSFQIRGQSWLSGRCDITGDTHRLAPLIHPLLLLFFPHIFSPTFFVFFFSSHCRGS